MDSAQQQRQNEGLPTPEWSMQGTRAELASRLEGFEFTGKGWYIGRDGTLLVVPVDEKPGEAPNRTLGGFLGMLGITADLGDEPEPEDTRYACYSWSNDPRPTMRALLKLGDQTEVPVPAGLAASWTTIQEQAEDLRKWANAEISRLAAERGADPIEFPPMGPLPTPLTKGQVKASDDGMTQYFVTVPWIIHTMNREQFESLTNGDELQPNIRVFKGAEDTFLALSISPPG